MLRFPSSAARAIGSSRPPPQCLALRHRALSARVQTRYMADAKDSRTGSGGKKNIKDSKPPILPGGANSAAPAVPPTPAASAASPPKTSTSPVTPSRTSPTQVPLTPPSPQKTQTSPPSGGAKPPAKDPTPPPPPPPPATSAPKKTHRFRNFILGLTLLTGGSFAGGVFYSLKSDNFHDFFTEYVPFGEEAVLYFEEQEFRRRFPNALARIPSNKPASEKVTIPRQAGATWKVQQEEQKARSTDVGRPGPHISGKKAEEEAKERTAAVDSAPLVHSSAASAVKPKVVDEKPAPKSEKSEKVQRVEKSEKTTNPSLIPGITGAGLQEVSLSDVHDPVVQELAKAVNSIIKVANEHGSSKAFEPVISKAKSELLALNTQLGNIKSELEKSAEDKLKEKDLEFTKAAQGLLTNVNNEIGQLEHRWRDEFESEREKLANSYREKLSTELRRSAELYEQRLRNELIEQAIEMKRKFINQIEDRVEQEREGRLGKLKELSDAVAELEKLSTSWTDVIDANLKTQQVFVALEAVRNAYESPEQPKPFLREMAALKEVADDDELIRAAIASINPLAYQNGVPTPTQLIDRFRKVSEEVRKAALLPDDAGVAAHAGSWLLSKLMFRKSGLPTTDDVESILTRTETYLEEGDIDNAAREMNQLTGWARTLARGWLKDARLLLEVQQAVDVVAAEARIQSLRTSTWN